MKGTPALPAENTVVKKKDVMHKVQFSRETLYAIALWYTGTGNNWKRLAVVNPQINPRRMQIGQVVRIPEPLLVRRRPMGRNFLKPAPARKPERLQRPRPASQKQPRRQEPIEAPPLYGPVVEDPPSNDEKKKVLPVPLETID